MSRRAYPYPTPQTQVQVQANVQEPAPENARQLQHTANRDARLWRPPIQALVQPPMPCLTTARRRVALAGLSADDPQPATATAAVATKVLKTFPPGVPGAVKLTRRYGPALVCVRYRLDATCSMRYTTVELIIEQVPIQHRAAAAHMVAIKLAFDETLLRSQALKMGAKWDAKARLWNMSTATAKALGLTSRIMKSGQ